jgi:hypothetical protein
LTVRHRSLHAAEQAVRRANNAAPQAKFPRRVLHLSVLKAAEVQFAATLRLSG